MHWRMRAPPSPPDDEGTLPNSKLDILDTGYFTWEDGADEYAALITNWWAGGYAATAGSHA
jgi:hypothetical protein